MAHNENQPQRRTVIFIHLHSGVSLKHWLLALPLSNTSDEQSPSVLCFVRVAPKPRMLLLVFLSISSLMTGVLYYHNSFIFITRIVMFLIILAFKKYLKGATLHVSRHLVHTQESTWSLYIQMYTDTSYPL